MLGPLGAPTEIWRTRLTQSQITPVSGLMAVEKRTVPHLDVEVAGAGILMPLLFFLDGDMLRILIGSLKLASVSSPLFLDPCRHWEREEGEEGRSRGCSGTSSLFRVSKVEELADQVMVACSPG